MKDREREMAAQHEKCELQGRVRGRPLRLGKEKKLRLKNEKKMRKKIYDLCERTAAAHTRNTKRTVRSSGCCQCLQAKPEPAR